MKELINNKEDIFDMSSLSVLDSFNKKTDEELLKNLKEKLECILTKVHSDSNKFKVDNYDNRISFACPYCGDSHNNSRKKRGNIYISSATFHCFNCYKHTSISRFLEDFSDYCDITPGELLDYKRLYKVTKNSFTKFDFLNSDLFKKYSFSKDYLIKKFNFQKIEESPGEIYLRNRCQNDLRYFAWDPKKYGVVIFNMDSEENVIGMQIRIIKKSKYKYYSYPIKQIYIDLNLPTPEDIEDVNKFSLLFGILRINLNEIVTIFEGPFDHMLFYNSFALATAGRTLPFEIENMRLCFDLDETGLRKSKEYLLDGKYVFLWKQFLKDNFIEIKENTKIDLTDLFIFAKENNIKLTSFDKYFTNNKLDIYYL